MNGGSVGFFNRTKSDNCKYAQELQMSTGPFQYQLYQGAHESCSKCIYDNF